MIKIEMMDKFVMIIFGASGDLTKRKLMPALYSLYRDKRLKGGFSVIGVGRTVYSMLITGLIFIQSWNSL